MWKKHKWSTNDIQKLLSMKQEGKTLKKISEYFKVSVNAISKALGRYSINHIKIPKQNHLNNNPIFYALEWCKNKNIQITKKDGGFYYNNKSISYLDFIILFNKFRVVHDENIVKFPAATRLMYRH